MCWRAPTEPLTGRIDGIYFANGTICIPRGSPVWDLSPARTHKLLHQARRLAPFSHDAEYAVWLLESTGACDGTIEPWILIRRQYRKPCERAADNPFLTDVQKKQCATAVATLRAWVQRRWDNRRRSRGKKRGARYCGRWSARRIAVERDAGVCRYCGVAVGHAFHVDHVIPRAYGGSDEADNLVVACVPCNSKKGGRTPAEAGMTLLPAPELAEAVL